MTTTLKFSTHEGVTVTVEVDRRNNNKSADGQLHEAIVNYAQHRADNAAAASSGKLPSGAPYSRDDDQRDRLLLAEEWTRVLAIADATRTPTHWSIIADATRTPTHWSIVGDAGRVSGVFHTTQSAEMVACIIGEVVRYASRAVAAHALASDSADDLVALGRGRGGAAPSMGSHPPTFTTPPPFEPPADEVALARLARAGAIRDTVTPRRGPAPRFGDVSAEPTVAAANAAAGLPPCGDRLSLGSELRVCARPTGHDGNHYDGKSDEWGTTVATPGLAPAAHAAAPPLASPNLAALAGAWAPEGPWRP